METNYRFSLEKYNGSKSRHTCPKCNTKNMFVRYKDNQTGAYLNEDVGRCNREDKCGYHYKPSDFFRDHPGYIITESIGSSTTKEHFNEKDCYCILPPQWINWSQDNFDNNYFIQYLRKIFDNKIVNALIETYHIGTSSHWPGAVIFWQVDINEYIRTGKIILYEPSSGKRIKQPFNHITWVHIVDKDDIEDPYGRRNTFRLEQCFFGEHLLKLYPTTPVAIVESEKTAIIASIYYPKYIWLATGGKSNLSPKFCQVLKGRDVTLFPDLNAFDKWTEKAKELTYLANFTISDVLEKIATATERENGLDLADYLIRYNYKQFIQNAGKANNSK
jgi:hypothetical protein